MRIWGGWRLCSALTAAEEWGLEDAPIPITHQCSQLQTFSIIAAFQASRGEHDLLGAVHLGPLEVAVNLEAQLPAELVRPHRETASCAVRSRVLRRVKRSRAGWGSGCRMAGMVTDGTTWLAGRSRVLALKGTSNTDGSVGQVRGR